MPFSPAIFCLIHHTQTHMEFCTLDFYLVLYYNWLVVFSSSSSSSSSPTSFGSFGFSPFFAVGHFLDYLKRIKFGLHNICCVHLLPKKLYNSIKSCPQTIYNNELC